MSSAVNLSVDAPEFISFRASEIISLDWWRVGVGDNPPSSRSSRRVGFPHLRQTDGGFLPFLESES